MLSWWQAHWSEYLCAFNLVIRLWPSKLGTKPNALTPHLDLYLKMEENIMVMLTHKIVDLFSHLINYRPHSELLPYFLQSFMDFFHWMWKSLTKIFFLLEHWSSCSLILQILIIPSMLNSQRFCRICLNWSMDLCTRFWASLALNSTVLSWSSSIRSSWY